MGPDPSPADAPLLVALPGHEDGAAALLAEGVHQRADLVVDRFPEGEPRLRLAHCVAGRRVDLFCPLARPEPQLTVLLLAALGARDMGATHVRLVAPYLPFLRQDRAFAEGELVSARLFAALLSSTFDSLLTVDPHLHRIARLDDIFGIPAIALSAAPLVAAHVAAHVPRPLIVGPDEESRQWAAAVAEALAAPLVVLAKERRGLRDVSVAGAHLERHAGCTPVLVDDIAGTGETLVAAAAAIVAAGLPPPLAVVTHCFLEGEGLARVRAATAGLVATDSVPHTASAIVLAPLLARALRAPAAPGSAGPAGRR